MNSIRFKQESPPPLRCIPRPKPNLSLHDDGIKFISRPKYFDLKEITYVEGAIHFFPDALRAHLRKDPKIPWSTNLWNSSPGFPRNLRQWDGEYFSNFIILPESDDESRRVTCMGRSRYWRAKQIVMAQHPRVNDGEAVVCYSRYLHLASLKSIWRIWVPPKLPDHQPEVAPITTPFTPIQPSNNNSDTIQNSAEMAASTGSIQQATTQTHSSSSGIDTPLEKEIKVIFQFKESVEGPVLRERPYSSCSSVKKIFDQAAVAGITTPDTLILILQVAAKEPQRIFFADREDFEDVKKAIECAKTELHRNGTAAAGEEQLIRVVVTPFLYGDEQTDQ